MTMMRYVLLKCVFNLHHILQNLLDDSMEEGEITSEVRVLCLLLNFVV